MIWATVCSRSCFCWLYRASPSLAAKNITNLISMLTIWWCPCVESSLVLLEEGVCYDQCVLLANTFSLCPASFRIPNLPVTLGVSWFSTFALQSAVMKRTSFWDVSSRRSCRSSWTHGHHQMVNTEIRLIIFFAAKDGVALYSQQKQDQELIVVQIMNSLLTNSDLNWRK